MRILVIAAALAAISAPAHSAPTAVASTPASTVDVASFDQGPYRDDAMRLAAVTLPQEPFVAMLHSALLNGFRLSLDKDGDALEAKSPGVIAELEKAVSDGADPVLLRMHGEAKARYARLFSRNFDAGETAELTQFYQSPVGQKLIAKKYSHLASPEFVKGLDFEAKTTAADVAKVNRTVAQNAVSEMTVADAVEMLKFRNNPVFAKLQAMKPVIDGLEAGVANKGDPELDAILATAVSKVLARRKLTD